MNILVTGATGFIGTHLTKRLVAEGHSVTAVIRSSSDTTKLPDDVTTTLFPEKSSDIDTIFQTGNFDGVIHLATLYIAEHTADVIPDLLETNVIFGTKLLDAAARAKVPWFINTGTFAQYSDVPSNLYAATKEAFSNILNYYAKATNINGITLVLFNTFGANDTRKKIFTLWNSAMRDGKTLDMSPGEQIIDITYIDNIVDGYCKAIELLEKDTLKKYNGAIFTLPSPERMTLRKLAETFSTVLAKPLSINFGATPYRPNEIMEPIKGTPLPEWKPKVSLHDGIRLVFADTL
ncbi:NAD-dependent epimerase/dehydratase [bacterium]|nr:NAD-dependent epimerase/dehydratase [bacterium]|tara:strand:+ start:11886 stop:12761 length:876 start_codon:yes stop_codon:yes gene_type:complete